MRRALVLLLTTVLACAVGVSTSTAAPGGSFTVLTYNVAGLPEPLSGSDPARNTPEIGRRIGAYDVVHVQEDFNYHDLLYAADQHPHRTETSGGVPFGSGLNTLSRFPVREFERVTWEHCWINVGDCLTPKGFTYSRVEIAPSVTVDLYNLHADAGDSELDLAARRTNLLQLSRYIDDHSAGQPVIVMGDTNSRYTRRGDILRELTDRNGLTDAWVHLVRDGTPPPVGAPAPECAGDADECEVVDKIFFRGSARVKLTATRYTNERAEFLTDDGQPLSDHDPISTEFRWTVRGPASAG